MTNKKNISHGQCLKDSSQRVISQDEMCRDLCGDVEGKKCEKGCMKAFAEIKQEDIFKRGFHQFNNIEVDQQRHVDAVVFFDGENIMTHLYPVDELNEKRLMLMREKGLSPTEINVMRFVLQGLSNEQIAEKLFISKVTLKTHLNNIYKKLPPALRPIRS